MKILGIIAEYNPFHNGHKYQLEKAKELVKPDITIVAMSGSFVQRGEPAIFDKWTRAGWALDMGADFVIEIPVSFSMASAERFAYGGVYLLNQLGITHLSFGAENSLESLLNAVMQIENMDTEMLKVSLSAGNSFAKARTLATGSNILSKPNNILACEYLKAIKKINKNIIPVAIERFMANHNENAPNGDFCSASYLREIISKGDYQKFTPVDYSSLSPVYSENFTKAIKYAVISKGADYIKGICEVREGLENKIYENAFSDGTLDEYILSIKSKRYTYSSISRMLFNILLDIRKDNITATPEFIRILGLKKEKSGYLKEISPDLPVITKCADAPYELIKQDFRATDIYNLFANKNGKADFTTSPVIKADEV